MVREIRVLELRAGISLIQLRAVAFFIANRLRESARDTYGAAGRVGGRSIERKQASNKEEV